MLNLLNMNLMVCECLFTLTFFAMIFVVAFGVTFSFKFMSMCDRKMFCLFMLMIGIVIVVNDKINILIGNILVLLNFVDKYSFGNCDVAKS